MKKLFDHLQPAKFRMTVFLLLCAGTMLSLLLFRLRTLLSGSVDYAFLVWNIFLAWLPLGIAYTASVLVLRRRYLVLIVPAATILWLAFFPNAPYLLTDLQYLGVARPGVPLWFDMLLLIWFAWTGLLLGVLSLFFMHDLVRRAFGRSAGWTFVLLVGVLGSLGIYMGRFLRWNSWDVFMHPLERFTEFLYYVSHPSMRSLLFIGIFSLFLISSYITLYAFGLLFHEQARQVPQEIK